MFFTAVLIAAGAITFGVIQNRYRQVHQTASWHESLLAAEAGIDIAVNELRKQIFDPDQAFKTWNVDLNGKTVEEAAVNDIKAYYTSNVLIRKGEGGQRSFSKITVDAPASLKNEADNEQWFRIRSIGVAEVPGGAVAAGEKQDLRLRKFSLRTDRRSEDAADPVEYSQATRLIEAVVKPVGVFRVALFGIKTIDMNNHNTGSDSYDSRDPSKSTNGFYDISKRQENGHVATNGTVIDAGNAHIYGNAYTNGGTVLDSDNVSGEVRDDFYQEVFPVKAPQVLPDPFTPDKVTKDTVLTAKSDKPAQYRLSEVKLASNTLHIEGAADGSPTYAQIVVTGDISTSGNGGITLGKGVYLRMFVMGDVDITGNGVLNPNSPLHFQIYGVDRPANADGSPTDPGDMKIAGNGGFRGTVYAPSYNLNMVGGGKDESIYGAFVAWSIRLTGVQFVHYDEALADGGLIADYKIVSWFEDTR